MKLTIASGGSPSAAPSLVFFCFADGLPGGSIVSNIDHKIYCNLPLHKVLGNHLPKAPILAMANRQSRRRPGRKS